MTWCDKALNRLALIDSSADAPVAARLGNGGHRSEQVAEEEDNALSGNLNGPFGHAARERLRSKASPESAFAIIELEPGRNYSFKE